MAADVVPALRLAALLCVVMGSGRTLYHGLVDGAWSPAAMAASLSYLIPLLTPLSSARQAQLLAAVGLLQATLIVALGVNLLVADIPLWQNFSLRYAAIPLISAVTSMIRGLRH